MSGKYSSGAPGDFFNWVLLESVAFRGVQPSGLFRFTKQNGLLHSANLMRSDGLDAGLSKGSERVTSGGPYEKEKLNNYIKTASLSSRK